MVTVIDEARRLKSQAMDVRDHGDFKQAAKLIEEAEQKLLAALNELRANRQNTEKPGRFEVEIANQLVHILGSKGGIFRRNRDYRASAYAYDAGYVFENPEAIYGIVNSYNLVQRLVSRVLITPESVWDENIEVLGLSVRRELLKAKEEIQRQLSGKRTEDEYASADFALVHLLLSDNDWEIALDNFIHAVPRPQPYTVKVTYESIEELREVFQQSPTAPSNLKDHLSLAARNLLAATTGD